MDGWVKIGTKLDNKGIEQDLKKLQSELTKLEREEIKLKVKLDKSQSGVSEYQKEIESLKQATEQDLKLAVSDEQAKNVLAVEEQTLALINDKYEKQLNTVSQIKSELEENKNKQQSIAQAIEQTNGSLNKAKGLSNIYEQVGNSASNIKDKMSSVISKVVKWGLALFGVRSIYSGIRSLMSTLSNYNEQIKTDLEYVKFAIAIGFEGIIQSIIKGVFTILQYINYIAMAWFGVNLFAKASANNFNKVKGGISGANKEAKELQKTLSGFDEMNVLNDSGGTSPGGGGGGMSPIDPSIDLSKMDVPIPKWLEWIAKNKDKILIFFTGLAIVIAGIKIAGFVNGLGKVAEGLKKVFAADKLLKAVGIGLMIAGVVLLIDNIRKLIFNWDEMTTKEKIITGVFATIGAAAIALGYAIATGISAATLGIGALIAAIIAVITAIVSFIAKLVKEEKAIKDVEQAQKDLKETQDEYYEATDAYIEAVERQEEAMINLKKAQEKTGLSGSDLYKQVQNGTLDYKDMTDAQREVYKAYLETNKAQKQLDDTTKTLNETKSKLTKATWDEKLSVATTKNEYNEYKKSVVDAFNKGEISSEEAKEAIEKAMTGMSRSSQKTFMEDLPDNIKNGLD